MIRRSDDKISIRKPSPFNGVGEITVRSLLNGPEEMENKGRVFGHTTVYPGSKIGLHTHKGDGTIVDVQPGDVYYCGDGECHSIEAIGEPIEMIALILYTT